MQRRMYRTYNLGEHTKNDTKHATEICVAVVALLSHIGFGSVGLALQDCRKPKPKHTTTTEGAIRQKWAACIAFK